MALKNLSPQDVAADLKAGKILLVDVREQNEFDGERIAGAVLVPLSKFDPKALPDSGGKPIVFQCAGGVRSAKAVAACEAAGLPHDKHMAGGIAAWKAAGLPVTK